MKTVISMCAAGVLAGFMFVSAAWAEKTDFSRYQVIVDKNLFGEPVPEPPPPSAAVQPPTPPPRSFVETLRLCGIHDEKNGAWVSFVDVGVNPNKSSYMQVGEENGDGVKVVEADVVGGRILVRKGDEEKWLGMEQPAAAAPAVGRPIGPIGPHAPGYLRPPPPGPVPAAMVNPSPVAPSSVSIAERLRQRREALERMRTAVTSPPPPAVTAPTNAVTELSPLEKMKKLREYNMELIKAKGAKGPPLPIQLTDEEDAQLVKEGVLPP
jgi:hypothetical protein